MAPSHAIPLQESKILQSYADKTPRSQALHARAKAILSNGVTHVGRYLEPHPVYVERAAGSRKWDIDGNEYVDYFGGHGALILGHNHPAVVESVMAQVPKGAHYGASHVLEVEWAELVHQLIPSAAQVRFTTSGTEATHLALRLARAFTGRNKIMRFAGHFHGWHDHVCFPPGGAPGILPGIVEDTLIVAPNDTEDVERTLSTRDDVAALILEPTGATFGQIPTGGDVLQRLREITASRGVLLIFDEVITGFRCSRGGAQQFYGVTPDLTTLAKIIAGGYPGAALAGRSDVLRLLEYSHAGGRIQPPPVMHQGTYNAGPVSAAAGIATLKQIRDTDAIDAANRTAAAIRDGMNAAIERRGLKWCVYGRFSEFHLHCGNASVEDIHAGRTPWRQLKGSTPPALVHKIRTGFLLHGVDIVGWPGGVVSAVHSAEDLRRTVSAFEATLGMLAGEGDL
ncbi:MAG TPA: aminotransferase class III-fold pyridoxal phosphate-dependent enzyme [Bryobacteraceae bacterium]|nr:aminotransferase class III-fold pyridoxal phosphate-dependent enzyme [Bryobacteraceae bacterium]